MSIRLAVAAASLSLLFGPPSIKVEAVATPATAAVKGAVFMITGRHHVSADEIRLTGRAEGIVNGKRVSQLLTLTPAGAPSTYGVTRQWAAGQPWVLVFTVLAAVHDSDGVAEATVQIAADGHVVKIDYPMGKIAGGYPWPRRAAGKEIDAALAALAKRE